MKCILCGSVADVVFEGSSFCKKCAARKAEFYGYKLDELKGLGD